MACTRKCVFGCDKLGAYMHKFPHPEKKTELFNSWLSVVSDKLQEKDPIKIFNNKRVCDYHFKPEQKVSGHRLIYLAVPTINFQGVLKNVESNIQIEHNYSVPRMNMDVTLSTPQPNKDFCKSHEAYKNGADSYDIPLNFDEETLPQNEVQVSTSKEEFELTPSRSIITKSTRKNQKLNRQLTILKMREKAYKTHIAELKELRFKSSFDNLLKNMSLPVQLFTTMQLTENDKKPRGRRFSLEQKIMSLLIYKKNPKSYQYLSKVFALPSPKSLQMFLKEIQLYPGMNNVIHEKLQNSPEALFLDIRTTWSDTQFSK